MADEKQNPLIAALINYLAKEGGSGRIMADAPVTELLKSMGASDADIKEIMGLRVKAEKGKLGALIRKSQPEPPDPLEGLKQNARAAGYQKTIRDAEPPKPDPNEELKTKAAASKYEKTIRENAPKPEAVPVTVAKQLREFGWTEKEIDKMDAASARSLLADETAKATKSKAAAETADVSKSVYKRTVAELEKDAVDKVALSEAGTRRRTKWAGLSELGKKRALGARMSAREAAGGTVPLAGKAAAASKIGMLEEAPGMLKPLIKKFPSLEGMLSKGNLAGLIGFALLSKLGDRVAEGMAGREQANAMQMMAGARTTEDILTDRENERAEAERVARAGQPAIDPRVVAMLQQMSQPPMTANQTYIGPNRLLSSLQDGSLSMSDLLARVQ